LAFAARNLVVRGIGIVLIGIACNALVITLNQGMPFKVPPGSEHKSWTQPSVKHHPRQPDDKLRFLSDTIVLKGPFEAVISFGDLILAVGANDQFIPADQYVTKLGRLVDRIEADVPDSEIILVAPYDVGGPGVAPIAGAIEQVAAARNLGLINLYEVAEFPAEFAKQVELIQRCAELTAAAMPRLQSLDLEEYWLEIGRLEKAGDKSFRRIITKLFSGNYDALEVLKLKDVVEKLEGAINAFETVAKRVEQIAVKES